MRVGGETKDVAVAEYRLVEDLKEVDPDKDGEDVPVRLASDVTVLKSGLCYLGKKTMVKPVATHVRLGELDALVTQNLERMITMLDLGLGVMNLVILLLGLVVAYVLLDLVQVGRHGGGTSNLNAKQLYTGDSCLLGGVVERWSEMAATSGGD